MATECPHCFRTVIPLAGGNCPNCRRNVKEPPSFGAGWGAVWITEQSKLPEACCTCDEPCQRTVTISKSLNYSTREESRSRHDDDDAARFIARLFLGKLFVSLYGLLTGGGGGE